MDQLLQVETLVLELLLIVSVVAIVGRRFRLPYTVALVLAGLALSIRSGLDIQLTPNLILSLFLPPLVFEAAFHLNIDELRGSLNTIVLLAVPGVILNMFLVGGVMTFGAGMSVPLALVFGALIAATDPVAVVSIFRKLGVPKRLEVMLEGESLLNDGTAIVIFSLAVAALETGEFSLVDGLVDFVRIAGGGLIIGFVLGWMVSRLIGQIDDYLVETTLTTVLAFGSYLLAEQLHFSGVLAVVAAGLVNGNIGQRGMSPTTRIVLFNFWEYMAFLANSAVFLIIGLQLDLPALLNNWTMILWAIAGVLVSRIVVIYGLSRLGQEIPLAWRHVLFWGGMRGAIALALALSFSGGLRSEQQTVTAMAFGVVLFTILGQGLTMDALLRRLKIVVKSDEKIEYERRHARALATRAGFEHVRRLHSEGLISSHIWENLRPIVEQRLRALTEAVQEALANSPEMETEQLVTARRESLRAQRNTLTGLRRDGVISEETYEELVAEIDLGLGSEVETWAASVMTHREVPDVRQLLLAIVQDRDLESAVSALAIRNIPSTRVQSTGGFLGRANHLLMVGVPEGRLEQAVEGLNQACRTRIEYMSSTVEVLPFPLPMPVEIEVKGATVFVFEVERYEEI
ncbi:MAG: Na+/H+ antiporter [Chloroflexi bacterium RBG_19FT_COMBO_62_14]|nr:MAG: Na+/H+ antiporter [Chloroflexi bacterium RBG_19FT_COMBO_62_14]